jgi:glycosyltransferase involved in cell wall biosynthesis
VAIDACAHAGVPLRVVGEGPARVELERRAESHGGASVEFLGWLTSEQVRDEYRRAAAVLMPGEEDFGIVPVEAQACGRPVVALARGGALETVVDGQTGVLVSEPSADALVAGFERLARARFDPDRLRTHALRFSRERHVAAMTAVIEETIAAPADHRW